MKKFILVFSLFLCLSFSLCIMPSVAETKPLKQGFYTAGDLKLSPNTGHTVRNPSFSERVYILIFDSNQNFLQSIRLRPQSEKYNLIPLKDDYTIVIDGDGEAIIS